MGIGTSIFLIAVGAILKFAVSATASGLDLQTVGVILMVVGVLGLLISLFFLNTWGGFGGYRSRTVTRTPERTVVQDRDRDVY